MLKLYGPSHCYCMGLYLNFFYALFYSFSFFSFFFFFFFSIYLQNGKSFDKQNTRVITFQSPVDLINYRVIIVAPPRDGTLLVK
jgi:hypothetical protein